MSRLAVKTKVQRLHYEDDIKHLNRSVNDISHEYSQRIEVLSQTFSEGNIKNIHVAAFQLIEKERLKWQNRFESQRSSHKRHLDMYRSSIKKLK